MNRRHTIGESVESVDRVVYHKNNRPSLVAERPPQAPIITNGGVAKSKYHMATSFECLYVCIYWLYAMENFSSCGKGRSSLGEGVEADVTDALSSSVGSVGTVNQRFKF